MNENGRKEEMNKNGRKEERNENGRKEGRKEGRAFGKTEHERGKGKQS